MAWMKALIRGLLYRFVRIDFNAKCPRCGHCSGVIHYDDSRDEVLHRCNICDAMWSEKPLINGR
ncbi:MAG: hypothetical protein KGL39_31790 [Patescibacteria group bacterium]|nr:hypothetical protein [Patescibacteria group bacterium]